MAEVRAGKQVCAVFYGHPGVFADVPHRVVRRAREEGIPARMELGISAEACLYADLNMDPAQRGVPSLEATHFPVHDRTPDPARSEEHTSELPQLMRTSSTICLLKKTNPMNA